MNPYEVLGVDKGATQEDIKDAYRKKAKENHPDVEEGNHEKMAEINAAYDILSDDEKRKQYDQTGNVKKDPTDRAYQILSNVFNDLVNGSFTDPNFFKKDVFDKMFSYLQTQYESAASKRKEFTKAIKHYQEIQQRIVCKPDQINIFDLVLENNICNAISLLMQLEGDLEVLMRAIEILKKFGFKTEKCEIRL